MCVCVWRGALFFFYLKFSKANREEKRIRFSRGDGYEAFWAVRLCKVCAEVKKVRETSGTDAEERQK